MKNIEILNNLSQLKKIKLTTFYIYSISWNHSEFFITGAGNIDADVIDDPENEKLFLDRAVYLNRELSLKYNLKIDPISFEYRPECFLLNAFLIIRRDNLSFNMVFDILNIFQKFLNLNYIFEAMVGMNGDSTLRDLGILDISFLYIIVNNDSIGLTKFILYPNSTLNLLINRVANNFETNDKDMPLLYVVLLYLPFCLDFFKKDNSSATLNNTQLYCSNIIPLHFQLEFEHKSFLRKLFLQYSKIF